MRALSLLISAGVAVLALSALRAFAGGEEVAVIYNPAEPGSQSVAEYYAQKRAVPPNQVIGLTLSNDNALDRASYNRTLAEPLLKELQGRGLVDFSQTIYPVRPGHPGHIGYTAIASRIRYLVLCYGVPYRVSHDATIDAAKDEEAPASLNPALRGNNASVDDELTLLPAFGQLHLYGPLANPLYGATNAAALSISNRVFLVSRVDGPTPAIAKGLVDKALEAERDGLNGRAYFDLRGLTAGEYKLGDDFIAHAADVAQRAGYETVIDRDPKTLPVGFPLSQVALYAGWYTGDADGPFTLPVVEFMPGAIAYHLHSFSGFSPRDPLKFWVGPLLAKGAAVTLGCVDEPYLQLTPDIGIFFERLVVQRMTVGEAGLVCRRGLSWQTIVVGDPLYRPFHREFLAAEKEHEQAASPLAAWDQVGKVNRYLLQGKDPAILRQYLIERPGAGNNAVLAEKIASMYGANAQYKQAIEWAQKSLRAGGSPQQRCRLLRQVADWQAVVTPADAPGTLEAFATEFPQHPDIREVRRRELEIAKDLGRSELAARLTAQLKQLDAAAAATNTAPH